MALVSPLVFIILVRRHEPNYVSLKQCFNKPLLNKTMSPLYSYYQPKTVASDLHDYGAPRDSICEVLCGFQRGSLSKQAPCFECLYWNTYFGILSSTKPNTARGLWFLQQESSIQMSSLYCKHFQIPATTSSKAKNIWILKLSRNLYNCTPILWSNSENQESSQTSRYLPYPKLTCWLGLRGF